MDNEFFNEFLVQKPQFDLKLFSPGSAISVTIKNNDFWIRRHCLIKSATPLQVEVVYVPDKKEYDYQDEYIEVLVYKILVNKVVSGDIRIEKLVEE